MKSYLAILAILLSTCQPGAEDKADARLQWLISLKLLELPPASAPLVCVPVSGGIPVGGKPYIGYAIGFLEEDDGNRFKVWLPNFCHMELSREMWARFNLSPERVVQKLTALEAAKLWCEWLDTESKGHRLYRVSSPMEEFAQMVVMAGILQQRSETEAAKILHRRTMTIPPNRGGDWPPGRDFDRDLKENLAEGLMDSVITDFGNTKIPRNQLDQRLTQIIQHLPETKEAKEAGSLAEQLRIVIAEEALADGRKLSDEALARLPLQERIAVLIKQLPNQTGRQMTSLGHFDIFSDDPAYASFGRRFQGDDSIKSNGVITPAGKLVKIGTAAVPQLLEAIDDRRPTRAVGWDQMVGQPGNLLDVGDCVFEILTKLSGRYFEGDGSSSDPDKVRAQKKFKAQGWWLEVQSGKEAERIDL